VAHSRDAEWIRGRLMGTDASTGVVCLGECPATLVQVPFPGGVTRSMLGHLE